MNIFSLAQMTNRTDSSKDARLCWVIETEKFIWNWSEIEVRSQCEMEWSKGRVLREGENLDWCEGERCEITKHGVLTSLKMNHCLFHWLIYCSRKHLGARSHQICWNFRSGLKGFKNYDGRTCDLDPEKIGWTRFNICWYN